MGQGPAASSLENLQKRMRSGPGLLFLALAAALFAAASAAARPPGITLQAKPGDPATLEGFEHFYNMEYDAAIANFEQALTAHPNDPFAVNHLLEGVLFRELHREGALDAQLYLGKEFLHEKKQAISPQVSRQISELIDRAASLSEAKLKTNPNDIDALYALGVTHGLQATYTALVEKSWFKALRNGLAAYKDHKRILQLDPNYNDAKLVVGIYNYVVGSLPWLVKVAAFLIAIHGSRDKGLELIHEAAAGGGEASVDAKTTLSLFLARENRYKEAVPLARELYQAFPRSFLYGLAAADIERNAGRLPQAAAAYRQLLALSKQGKFHGDHVEFAAFNLGRTLREEKNHLGAAEAYGQVAGFPEADPGIVRRANLAAGQMFDLAGKRTLAVEKYRQVLAAGEDSPEAKTARDLLGHPYRGS